MPCTTVTNFCSEGKVTLLLSMVCYQVLLCFRHTRHGRYCYKQAMKVKLQVFYHVLKYAIAKEWELYVIQLAKPRKRNAG